MQQERRQDKNSHTFGYVQNRMCWIVVYIIIVWTLKRQPGLTSAEQSLNLKVANSQKILLFWWYIKTIKQIHVPTPNLFYTYLIKKVDRPTLISFIYFWNMLNIIIFWEFAPFNGLSKCCQCSFGNFYDLFLQ